MLLKGNQSHSSLPNPPDDEESGLKLKWQYAFMLGIVIKLGGCSVNWNYGLAGGFWGYFISIVVIGCGYIMLGLCMSEMVSIMSFSGGYYGYARCAIGPFVGFIVGCCSIFESTFQCSISIMKIGQFFTAVLGISRIWEPVCWLCMFIVMISFHLLGVKSLWNAIAILAILSLSLMAIFLFGSIPELDFQQYATHYPLHSSGREELFTVFRLATLFFMGYDMLTLTSNHIENPKQSIPTAMISLIAFLLILALWLLVTVSSQYPGISEELYQETTLFPLSFGFANMFKISTKQALALAVIPSFGTCIGYSYIFAKQVMSMSKSGLLPGLFKQTIGEGTPIWGMIYIMLLAFVGLFYAWAVNPYTTLSRLAMLASCFVYLLMFCCYIIFNTRFSNLERHFRSPLGIPGAVIGIMIFLGTFVMMIIINHKNFHVALIFLAYLLIMTAYYYFYAEFHQTFSLSEQKVFFKAYIVNMKRRKKLPMYARVSNDLLRMFHLKSDKSTKGKVYASCDSHRINLSGSLSSNSYEASNSINSPGIALHKHPQGSSINCSVHGHQLHHSVTDRTSGRNSSSISISADRHSISNHQQHTTSPSMMIHYFHPQPIDRLSRSILAPSIVQVVPENDIEEAVPRRNSIPHLDENQARQLQNQQLDDHHDGTNDDTAAMGNDELEREIHKIIFPKSTKMLISALTGTAADGENSQRIVTKQSGLLSLSRNNSRRLIVADDQNDLIGATTSKQFELHAYSHSNKFAYHFGSPTNTPERYGSPLQLPNDLHDQHNSESMHNNIDEIPQ